MAVLVREHGRTWRPSTVALLEAWVIADAAKRASQAEQPARRCQTPECFAITTRSRCPRCGAVMYPDEATA